MKSFKLKPEIIFGENSLDFLLSLKDKRVFIVADPFMCQSGKVDLICKRLGEKYEIFSDIMPDPPMEVVTKGIAKLTAFSPDTVIAVGGGSAIDAAKAILCFSKQIAKTGEIPFIAIPTTSGTGSEVTSFSVITNAEKGIKYPLVSDELLPDIAILETEFVKSLPKGIVADTGMDVLTHAIEAYVSTKATDFSDAFAEKAVSLVFENLKKSCTGDFAAREKMHIASTLAGLAFNEASLGLNHAIAHNIGGRLKLPHGRTNAVLLTAVIEFNADIEGYSAKPTVAAEKYARLAKLIGCKSVTVRGLMRELISEIATLQRDVGIPKTFTGCGVSPDLLKKELTAIAEGAIEDGCIKTNPKPVSYEDICGIIKKLSGGAE